ncbi:2-C-methyl-D-erythritol 2,4-cyclodiphosphate synthase [bacterium]|nr:2-C-methyl-D-erythritol 2,4-cyclodiphosphate synthase [bacterium]MBU1153015.1 2-C-methyl-D-erythritol 2,4-cyclodiphosphate synthase [bacterium]
MIRFGIGFDTHELVEGRDLILGGVKIPFSKGLSGHSDADVLVHGIIDALLGALNKGDIGQVFGVDKPETKGISSLVLLEKVYLIMKEMGFSLNNIDVTIITEKPRLAPYITKMKENIALTLKVQIEEISIKATTAKKLGFIGREQAIASLVVGSIIK